jgi:CRP-like cAMP-binding protein
MMVIFTSKKSDQHYDEELVVLNQGQYFGEWGIIENKVRKASAIALEDCDMFLLDKKYFLQTIGVYFVVIIEKYG